MTFKCAPGTIFNHLWYNATPFLLLKEYFHNILRQFLQKEIQQLTQYRSHSSLPADPLACPDYSILSSYTDSIVTQPILYTDINKAHCPIGLKLISCRPLNSQSQFLLCMTEYPFSPMETILLSCESLITCLFFHY